jgi:poly(beta-D-mannuronate) lyase
MHLREVAIVVTLCLAASLSAAENDLLSKAKVVDPDASFLDVAARRAELAHATAPRVVEALAIKSDCVHQQLPAPPPGVMIIPHHYLTGSNGPINPEEAAATAPYRRLDDVVTFGAGRYVADGDPAQAVCVDNLLSKWAAARALLDYTFQESSQAWYQVEWTLSSISWRGP